MNEHGREEKIRRLRPQATSLFAQRYNIYSIKGNETQIVDSELHRFSELYTEEKTFNLFVGTWNVNAKLPPSDLTRWLTPTRSSKHNITANQIDIYALGFQEIVDLNAANLVVDHSATKPWETRIYDFLGSDYDLLTSRHLVGLSLVIYVRKNLGVHVTDVIDEKCGVGIMGVGANKGALATRFMINDFSLCFVNSHLAAHQQNVKGRNDDYHTICQRVQFKIRNNDSENRTIGILDHDEVFWMGDLNYRINLPLDEAYSYIERGDFRALTAFDQLLTEREAGNAFEKFVEGEINFSPTYKYLPGTSEYDRRPDKKRRIPAWCDRILWLGTPRVRQLFYRAETSLCISDHMPVCSLFELRRIRIENNDLKRRVRDETMKGLEDYISTYNPTLDVLPDEIDFGNVAYDVRQIKHIYIANTGRVDATCEISVSRDSTTESITSKDVISVWPKVKTIKVNSAVNIMIELKITSSHSFAIASNGGQFKRLVRIKAPGIDKVVVIKGVYLKSCFGVPLSWLINCHGPVRTSVLPIHYVDQNPLPVPKELWRIINAITTHGDGLRFDGIFGEEYYDSETCFQETALLRECLDRAIAFPSKDMYSIHALTQVLTGFLQSLTEPVYPVALANRYMNMNLSLHEFCRHALLLLPPVHYNCFVYIISFLRELLQYSNENHVMEEKLIQIFVGPLMHPHSLHLSNTDKKDTAASGTQLQNSTNTDSIRMNANSSYASSSTGGHDSTASMKNIFENCSTILRHYVVSHDFNV